MGGKRYSQLFCDGLLMAQRVNHDGGVPMKGKPFKPGNKSAWKPGQSGGNSRAESPRISGASWKNLAAISIRKWARRETNT